MRGGILLLAFVLVAHLPPLVAASHCQVFLLPERSTFWLCDADSDGAPDSVRFSFGATGTSGAATAYEEQYARQGRIRASYVFQAGGPLGPTFYGQTGATDNGPNGRYDDAAGSGGVYVPGSGMPRLAWVAVADDRNDNGQPERIDVVLCTTETGCRILF